MILLIAFGALGFVAGAFIGATIGVYLVIRGNP